MRKDALATELHFILDAKRVPTEAFLLERILYLEDDGTEFAPPRTARRQITMDEARVVFDHAAAAAIDEVRALSERLSMANADVAARTAEMAALVAEIKAEREEVSDTEAKRAAQSETMKQLMSDAATQLQSLASDVSAKQTRINELEAETAGLKAELQKLKRGRV